MSETSPILSLPLLAAAQAQKHVTHNEALMLLDALVQLAVKTRALGEPPVNPANGDCYIVAAAASGAWLGHDGEIAFADQGSWRFVNPRVGWRAWDIAAGELVVRGTSGWDLVNGQSEQQPLLGLNTTADTSNRLALSSPASLFSHEGAGHQLKINKAATNDTAAILFQTAWSGRAEFGLTGDDNWHVKVSPDGGTWHEAIVVDRATGRVSMPLTPMREVLTANRTYYVAPSGSDAYDGRSAGSPFATIQKACDVAFSGLDIGPFTVTIQLADGTYSAGVLVNGPPLGSGTVQIVGNASAPQNVLLNVTGSALQIFAGSRLTVRGVKVAATNYGCVAGSGAALTIRDIEFGACGTDHLYAQGSASIFVASGSYTISGDALRHIRAFNGQVTLAGRTVTLAGAPNFAVAFCEAENTGFIQANGNTFAGSATGKRYTVTGNGVRRDNQGARAASIRMRMRRWWADGRRA